MNRGLVLSAVVALLSVAPVGHSGVAAGIPGKGKAFAGWALIGNASAVFGLSQPAFPAAGTPAVRYALTVSEMRLLCAHGPRRRYTVRAHGYYALYPFFGPGPPATPISYQTGYLFDNKVRMPIDTTTASAGVLVMGPQLGVEPQLPEAGWVQITGRWNCASFRLELRSWGLWLHP